MSPCDDASVLLAGTVDAPARVPLRLREHLDQCAACRATAAELWLGPAAAASSTMDARITPAAVAPIELLWPRRRSIVAPVVAAVVLVAAAAGILLAVRTAEHTRSKERGIERAPSPGGNLPPPPAPRSVAPDPQPDDDEWRAPEPRQELGPRGRARDAPRVIISRGPGYSLIDREKPMDVVILIDASPSWLGVRGAFEQEYRGERDDAARALEYLRRALPRRTRVELALFRGGKPQVAYPLGAASGLRGSMVPWPADGAGDPPADRSATAAALRWGAARPVAAGRQRVILLIGSSADLTVADPAVAAAREELRAARVPLVAIHAHHDDVPISDEWASLDALAPFGTICSLSDYEVAYPDILDCARALAPLLGARP